MAVANELKKLLPDARIIYIGQKGDRLADIPAAHPAIDETYAVWAGKFRRYHGEGWRQVFDVPTQGKNIRDAFRVLAGLWQSFWLLRRLKPQVIFTRGGFVSVPVALGGKLNGVPFITHDSDSTPSLANRIIAPWAALHAVALPAELYPYPPAKTIMVGVPVDGSYVPITSKLQHEYRQELGLGHYQRMLLVTGGGNGAAQLNDVVLKNASMLLRQHQGLIIVHLAGRALSEVTDRAYDQLGLGADRGRVIVKGFVTDLYRYSGGADVIIARGGATGLAEFALQGKACVIVPAKQLLWQSHHAHVLAERNAIICLTEAEAEHDGRLGRVVSELLGDDAQQRQLGEALSHFARPDAARRLAMVLLEQACAENA